MASIPRRTPVKAQRSPRSAIDDTRSAKRARYTDHIFQPRPISPWYPPFLGPDSGLRQDQGEEAAASIEKVSVWLERQRTNQTNIALSEDLRVLELRPTRSAPAINPRDLMPPPTPKASQASVPSSTAVDSTLADTASRRGSTKTDRLVESVNYRSHNLEFNHIFLRDEDEELPAGIAAILDVIEKKRTSPGLSTKEYQTHRQELKGLQWDASEDEVQQFFREKIFPKGDGASLTMAANQFMNRASMPKYDAIYKLSIPKPDLQYGYNAKRAFAASQERLRNSIPGQKGTRDTIVLPFFVVEFKADGRSASGGRLWVANNQCMGAGATCANIADQLNRFCTLKTAPSNPNAVQMIETATFSIAMTATEAVLFVSWKSGDQDFYTQMVESFNLRKEDDYKAFRNYVLNVVDWGKNTRLAEIQECLNQMLEASRKQVSTEGT